jgi:hypothetical protein
LLQLGRPCARHQGGVCRYSTREQDQERIGTSLTRATGFVAHRPNLPTSPSYVVAHIALGSKHSPFISLTRSYAVAYDYALHGGGLTVIATATNPGYVYEVRIDPPLPRGLRLIDPIKAVSSRLPSPMSMVGYQHSGPQRFLIGVVSPRKHRRFLTTPCVAPPYGAASVAVPSAATDALNTLVWALRDAEILAVGTIPNGHVTNRFSVP